MLAPLRDHLCPKDPTSSPLLCTTKENYFSRLLVHVHPDKPGFEEARWITSEDVNIEHLFDVFITTDTNSTIIWDVCCSFMQHLFFHKPRLVMLGPKIEGLPDDHPSKAECLFQLSQLFDCLGNQVERKRLLVHSLKLWKELGDDREVAETLGFLSDANRRLELCEEWIKQAEGALEIFERLNDKSAQAKSWCQLGWLLYEDNQLDAAEEAASRVLDFIPDEGEQFRACKCHRLLGLIYRSKGKIEEAINNFETALGIASLFNWHDEIFWNHFNLAAVFSDEERFNDTHAHIEHAKSHTINDPYLLGCVMELRARVWCKERKFEEAKSEALGAAGVYGKIGATRNIEGCRAILRDIEEKMKIPVTSGDTDFKSEFL